MCHEGSERLNVAGFRLRYSPAQDCLEPRICLNSSSDHANSISFEANT